MHVALPRAYPTRSQLTTKDESIPIERIKHRQQRSSDSSPSDIPNAAEESIGRASSMPDASIRKAS
jgi:hypothetical protein